MEAVKPLQRCPTEAGDEPRGTAFCNIEQYNLISLCVGTSGGRVKDAQFVANFFDMSV
jgi:hypothetical protein